MELMIRVRDHFDLLVVKIQLMQILLRVGFEPLTLGLQDKGMSVPLGLDSIAFFTSLQSLVADVGGLVASPLFVFILELVLLANCLNLTRTKYSMF